MRRCFGKVENTEFIPRPGEVNYSIIKFSKNTGNIYKICSKLMLKILNPVYIYLFKVKNGYTRTMYDIFSKLTIKAPERRQLRCCGVLIVYFEQVSHFE